MKKAASESPSPKARKKPALDPAAPSATKPPAPRSRKSAGKPVPEPVSPAAIPGAATKTTSLTVIAARVDIGYGNHLYLRGTGPGLSWDIGVPMTNAGSDLWSIDLHGATGPVYCKFLINDQLWSAGPDYEVEPGAQLEVTPLF